MRRFDITPEGTPLGFEDMCSLQALGTLQKYRSSYERVAKSINSFVSGENLIAAREQFFVTLVLSLMVQNGDAHLKNFGALYSSPSGLVSLAPVYDVVTTTVYVTKDVPVLSLACTKKWWSKKILERFGVTHWSIPVATISGIFQHVAQSVTETREMSRTYINKHPEFKDIGRSMMTQWNEGIRTFFE
jgi:serine/threonine-protein kinase HipA